MNRIIIACRTLEEELKQAMDRCNCTAPVIWLDAGAHNVPEKRRKSIENALADCEGFDTVLLCMSFCGNSLVGLKSGGHSLVLPRFDDCIPLLLGAHPREQDTYYLSPGWMSGRENLLSEYEKTVEKYGSARADRMFSSMLCHYRKLVWIGDTPSLPDSVQEFAARFGLELQIKKGSPILIEKLVQGSWDTNFLVVPPATQITLEMRKVKRSHV